MMMMLIKNKSRITKNISLTRLEAVKTKSWTIPKIIVVERQARTAVKDSYFAVVDSVSKLVMQSEAKYVVIIPHRIQNIDLGFRVLEKNDQQSVKFLGHMLNSLSELDGATCIPARAIHNIVNFPPELRDIAWRKIFNTSCCNFARRDWSIQIRNTGKIQLLNIHNIPKSPNHFTNISIPNIFQLCNIINGPFVLRKDKFIELDNLNSNFGRLTMLDFFMRTKGKLKIGKFGNCLLSDHLFRIDRAELQGSSDFTEYSNFGVRHGILRIIMEDRIEWTKCSVSGKLCKEKPYVPPTTLPQVGQPICCSVVLGKTLKDVTDVFVKLGVKHRVVYGTLLGAVRNNAIIPWTHDVDISLEGKNTNNETFFAMVQEYLKDRYYVGTSFMYMSRGIPLLPPHIDVKTTGFFDGDNDLQGDKFFNPAITESVRELLPVTGSDWRSRGYLDFYTAPEIWWNGSSTININGDSYVTVKEIDYELKNWYGKNYMKPALEGNWIGMSDRGSVEG
jgi:hypothetical protein